MLEENKNLVEKVQGVKEANIQLGWSLSNRYVELCNETKQLHGYLSANFNARYPTKEDLHEKLSYLKNLYEGIYMAIDNLKDVTFLEDVKKELEDKTLIDLRQGLSGTWHGGVGENLDEIFEENKELNKFYRLH